jgi:type IV pilus assembly protein PilO
MSPIKIIIELIKTKKKSIIAILALAVINLSIYGFTNYFQEPQLEKLQKEWFDKRRIGGGFLDKEIVYAQGKKDLETFLAKIPPKKDFIRETGELFEIASNNGLKISSVGYKPEMLKGRDILNYTLTFSVKGGYAAIKSFISDIERSPEILSIDSLSLTNPDISGDAVNFSVKISTFFRVEKP